jgi:predicted enzyme related to lactoylglutathione lyase
MSAATGRFVWYDLMTTDVERAKAFYTELVGWKTARFNGGDYELWAVGDRRVGGVMPIQEEARRAGTPPHWLGYVATESVDSTVQRAQRLGGKVHVPATDIPDTGRYAVLQDPQGAAFGVYQSVRKSPAPEPRALGNFGWAELNTTDWKAAWRFYSELLGWRPTTSMDMGPALGEYFMFGLEADQMIGGMSNAANMMKAPAHWLHYANVKSTDETAKRIPQLGGKVLNGPMDVPGGDRIAQCVDPLGARFAIFSAAPKAG